MSVSTAQTLNSLRSARDIVLRDAAIYPQVVPGIVGVTGADQVLDLRRWGADFLAETFASPVLSSEEKQNLCLVVLDTLASYLTRKETRGEEEDPNVVKSAVQCAASIYQLLFRHTIMAPMDGETWSKMARIKSSILRRMDSAAAGVRVCCIKFVARVVQVHTPGVIADPRRQEQNEISLSLVPRDHPILEHPKLEAESSALLDRLLGVLQDNDTDALVVTATLNALSTLVHRRATVSQKIIATVLMFDPLKLAIGPLSGKDRIAVNSMTRTTMAFLVNVLKRNSQNLLAQRIQQRVELLRQKLHLAFTEKPTKRPALDEPIDGLDDAKRRRIEQEVINGTTREQQSPPPNLPQHSGPTSHKDLFTLTQDPVAIGFHVQALSPDIVSQLLPAVLKNIDGAKLDEAINTIRKRLLDLDKRPPATATDAARTVAGEDDDDYDPLATEFGEYEQVANRLDQAPDQVEDEVAIGPFDLPAPPPLSEQERQEYSKTALIRVFGTLTELDQEARARGLKKSDGEKGFNRLAVTGHDREGWLTLVTRLATRASFDLSDNPGSTIKKQDSLNKKDQTFDLGTSIRRSLQTYVMEDFRRRIDVAITWLNEEWYSDRLFQQQQLAENPSLLAPTTDDLLNYNTYTLRLLDAITPYIDVKDGKLLIRLLSEIPTLNAEILRRVVKLADDPERVSMSVQALLYLIMFRPPVREIAVDAVEAMWKQNREAKAAAAKVLGRWRPAVLREQEEEKVEVEV